MNFKGSTRMMSGNIRVFILKHCERLELFIYLLIMISDSQKMHELEILLSFKWIKNESNKVS